MGTVLQLGSQRGNIRYSKTWDISYRFILNTGWQYYTETKKPSWFPRGGAGFLKTLISLSISLSFGDPRLYTIKYNLLTGIFNPWRLALNHELRNPRGCSKTLLWSPGWGRGSLCNPTRTASHAGTLAWRPPSCFAAFVVQPLHSGCDWWRLAHPFTMDQHHGPQQATGVAEWFIRRDCKRYFKSKLPHSAV